MFGIFAMGAGMKAGGFVAAVNLALKNMGKIDLRSGLAPFSFGLGICCQPKRKNTEQNRDMYEKRFHPLSCPPAVIIAPMALPTS